jgi:orotidine-5'-phosphate decarboxylase
MSFREKLTRAAERNRSLLCVGLDPDPDRLSERDIGGYLCAVVEATSDLVCAYKPNLAFYEQFGERGYAALRAVLSAIPDSIPVIADAKRGDIQHTAEAYARAIFDELGFDAATVNPYLGGDSVEPFLARPDRTALIVCRTSNPGARDLQDLLVGEGPAARPLYEVVAEMALRWDRHGNVGLVTGATYPDEMRRLRALCPDLPFLIPGIGPQEGALEDAVRAGLDARGSGIIVNASRAVLYASAGDDFAAAARGQAESLRAAIEDLRSSQLAASRS